MDVSPHRKYIETAIFSIIWLIIVSVAIFSNQSSSEFLWRKAVFSLIWFIPFFVIFIVNNALLVPKLLFKKKFATYFILTILFILAASHPLITKQLHDALGKRSQQHTQEPMLGLERNIPNSGFLVTPPPPQGRQRIPQSHPMLEAKKKKRTTGKYLSNLLIGFLVIGFNTAIKQASRLFKEEEKRHLLEEEKLQAELSFLKHQISPHFLMNTLNNIHALVDIDKEDAQSSIVQLSTMLRYILYEKDIEKTPLSREIEFIKSYVNLMKIRYNDLLDLQLDIEKNLPNISIPPFVFITIIENAFKHGVTSSKTCFIHIAIHVTGNELCFSCSNSKVENIQTQESENHGIGLENTRKRLQLFYGSKYLWEISDKNDTYTSTIKIPVHEN